MGIAIDLPNLRFNELTITLLASVTCHLVFHILITNKDSAKTMVVYLTITHSIQVLGQDLHMKHNWMALHEHKVLL